jgi:hypothetical protein
LRCTSPVLAKNRVNSPGDAKAGAAGAVGGGTAAPEPRSTTAGPSTNEPELKDEDTAVARNDDPKGGGQAGKRNVHRDLAG